MMRTLYSALLISGLSWQSADCQGQGSSPSSELGSTMTAEALFGSPRPTEAKAQVAPKTSSLSVDPVAEPRPALQYRFWPRRIELKPGSANLYAARALVSLQHVDLGWTREAEQDGREHPFQMDFQVSPRIEDIRHYSDAVEQICNELGRLAFCEDQTRDLRIRDERGAAIFSTLLPEIQASRSLAKALRFRIRTLALQQEYDDAIAQLLVGFRLSEYIGDGETIIERLVGNAIASMMCDEIEFLVQQPDCPNLYWALAGLPADLGDPADQALLEMSLMQRHLPILQMAESDDFSDEVWLAHVAKAAEDLRGLGQSDLSFVSMLQLLSDNSTPSARQSLIDHGLDASVVKQMSKIRAVLLNANYQIAEQTDALKKGFLLQEPMRQRVIETSDASFGKWRDENPDSFASMLTGLLLPAVSTVNRSGIRTQLRIRRLMAVEAIRNFAANNGQLPETLEAIVDLPVPRDPFTDTAFGYSVGSETNLMSFDLSADVPEDADFLRELHVELRRK